jgi:hypothetical protein
MVGHRGYHRCDFPNFSSTGRNGPGATIFARRIMSRVFSVDPARRFLFWATFHGGDPDRPVRVGFDLDGHGRGFYFRHEGDEPVSLLRYDRWSQPAAPWNTGLPRGAVLRAPALPFGGNWRPSELPDRQVLFGADHGEPVGYAQAVEIAQQLGYEPWILDEPTLAV